MLETIATHNDAHPPDEDINVIPVTVTPPPWARNEPEATGCTSAKPPSTDADDETAWAAFNGLVADRYGAERYGLRAIEVWNEPNLSKFWDAPRNPERFARLVNKANEDIEQYGGPGRPNFGPILVLPGGLSPEGNDPKQYLLDAMNPAATSHITFGAVDTAGAVDALSVHLYASFAQTTKRARINIKRDYNALGEALAQHGQGSTDRWITEIGFPTVPGGPRAIPTRAAGPLRQCRRLRDQYLRYAMKDEVKTLVVHRLVDADQAAGDNEGNNFGVLERGGSGAFPAKPVFRVLRRLATPGGQHEEVKCQ